MNAEPNYGHLWLYCKKSSLSSIKQIFYTAYSLLKMNISNNQINHNEMLSLYWNFQNYQTWNQEEKWMLIFGGENLIN